MSPPWQHAADLVQGPLLTAGAPWPLSLCALLCDLRPRFLPKGQAGRGYRAIARNGRVLLAGDAPLAELAGRCVRLRLQTWHRALLPGDRPRPYGLLLWVRLADGDEPECETRLARHGEGSADLALALDVGGGQALHFRRLGG
jgi:hypothetical protein